MTAAQTMPALNPIQRQTSELSIDEVWRFALCLASDEAARFDPAQNGYPKGGSIAASRRQLICRMDRSKLDHLVIKIATLERLFEQARDQPDSTFWVAKQKELEVAQEELAGLQQQRRRLMVPQTEEL